MHAQHGHPISHLLVSISCSKLACPAQLPLNDYHRQTISLYNPRQGSTMPSISDDTITSVAARTGPSPQHHVLICLVLHVEFVRSCAPATIARLVPALLHPMWLSLPLITCRWAWHVPRLPKACSLSAAAQMHTSAHTPRQLSALPASAATRAGPGLQPL